MFSITLSSIHKTNKSILRFILRSKLGEIFTIIFSCFSPDLKLWTAKRLQPLRPDQWRCSTMWHVAHNISPAKHYSLLLFYSPFFLLLEVSFGDNFSSFGSAESVSEFGKTSCFLFNFYLLQIEIFPISV